MGIPIEFNPDLALRDKQEYENGNREADECIPEPLEEGKEYGFLKAGHRNHWLMGEIPLLKTAGNEQLSRPIASIRILESTHFLKDEKPYTRGRYRVIEVFKDDKVYFNSYARV